MPVHDKQTSKLLKFKRNVHCHVTPTKCDDGDSLVCLLLHYESATFLVVAVAAIVRGNVCSGAHLVTVLFSVQNALQKYLRPGQKRTNA